MSDWTPEQFELLDVGAAGFPKLPRVAVSADAGSGKTSVLAERVRRFLEGTASRASEPPRVLCVSFTEKSAADLEERLASSPTVEVYTIHGFCARVVLEFGATLGFPPLLRIVDQEEAADLFRESFDRVYRRVPPATTDHGMEAFRKLCNLARERAVEIRAHGGEDAALPAFVREVLAEFGRMKEARRVLEYADLERFAASLLEKEQVAAVLRHRYAHVFVDEFQDTSEIQCRLVQRLRGDDGCLFVVGDVKQSIYRFRGADVEVFKRFVGNLPARRALSTNFRSHPEIIGAVNSVCGPILEGYEPMVAGRSSPEDGAPEALPRVLRVTCDEDADGIAALLNRLRREGTDLSQVVLLLPRMRGNEKLLEGLTARGFAVAATSAGSAGSDPRVGALVNLWIWACEPWQALRAARVAVDFGGAGVHGDLAGAIARLVAPVASAAGSCEEFLATLDARFDLARRYGPVFEQFRAFVLSHQAQGYLPARLARRLSRLTGSGVGDRGLAGLTLIPPPPSLQGTLRAMTVHASKGLEFPVVILADLKGRKPRVGGAMISGSDAIWLAGRDEQGELVKSEEFQEAVRREVDAEVEESARLLYVALTRAKEKLFLVDRPDCGGRSQAAKRAKAPALPRDWSAWIQAAGLPTIPIDVLERSSGRSAAPEGANAPSASAIPAARQRALSDETPRYRRARTGATEILAPAPSSPRRRPGPAEGRAMDAREFGTATHEFLEFEDWNGLEARAAAAGVDVSRFLDWVKTPAGQEVFGEAAPGRRVYREFACEWRHADFGVVTGRIDRLVVFPDQAWVLDYKVLQPDRSGALRSDREILARYAPQLSLYGDAVKTLTGLPRVRAFLLDVACATGQILHEVEIRA